MGLEGMAVDLADLDTKDLAPYVPRKQGVGGSHGLRAEAFRREPFAFT